MHIIYTANGIPYPGDNGIPMMGWGLVRGMLARNIKVTVIGLCNENDSTCNQIFIQDLISLGVNVKILKYQNPELKYRGLKGVLSRLSFSQLYPASMLTKKLSSLLSEINADAIIAVHTEPLAALLNSENDIPVLGIMGDPTSQPAYFRWKSFGVRKLSSLIPNLLWLKALTYYYNKFDVKMLQSCTGRGVVAAHYSKWFSKRGVDDCNYFPIPIYDEGPLITDRYKNGFGVSKIKKIIMLGALHTTVTMIGLKYFSENLFSLFEEKLKFDFKVHIIGSGQWPNGIIKPESNKIILRGYVEDLSKDWLDADILLVPTNMELGIRARILTALSKGMCVVAHLANVKGIPELIHGYNCILGATPVELVNGMNQIFSDSNYAANISSNARNTFEKTFSPEVASSKIIDKVFDIIK
jgi:glycosyltransferase involved in cell wall biosynthesis